MLISFICSQAIVNEDASGDVIAMRVQIQQLKVHDFLCVCGHTHSIFCLIDWVSLSFSEDYVGTCRFNGGEHLPQGQSSNLPHPLASFLPKDLSGKIMP